MSAAVKGGEQMADATFFEFDSETTMGVHLSVDHRQIHGSTRFEVCVDGKILAAYLGPKDCVTLAHLLLIQSEGPRS